MNWQSERTMSPEQYSWTIRQLGMNKSQAARYLGVSLRTGQRYWDGVTPVPVATGILLRLLLHYRIPPQVPPWTGRKAVTLSEGTG
jgi:hypothetical protein